ncbi:hypothetical protein L207DRAFT_565401 [Hyaloscypha variabilis F]|uniref:Fungal N-terminal domain-containing protein n=1 Tax=Hyaloscypha variabilis (strain UAMH 11265 / GT02V1 / F) TaxID=1149755 RepID=A0A2J6RSR4_HYAVF|nr:hypothetical protein L207DRAFT_565401 [Hyaloscypha variabilis F]
MSFGTSIGDIILLIQLAHQSYRNCKQAGGQYLEIAREVRNLHSVLRNVRDEAEIPDSALFQADSTTASNLKTTTDGCREALEGVEALLAKYHGLAEDGLEVSGAKKFWHRWKFGNELDEVVKFRWKIMSYTSTMAVLMDSINLGATNRVEKTAGRVEDKVEAGFNKVMDRLEGFEDMRKAVLYVATKARASERFDSVASINSVLSLSTYPDDNPEVWRQFRRELISIGFRSDSLDRNMESLKAYMMKLEKTGVLDQAVAHTRALNHPNKFPHLTNTPLKVIKEVHDTPLGSTIGNSSNPNIKASLDANLLQDPELMPRVEILKTGLDEASLSNLPHQVLRAQIKERIEASRNVTGQASFGVHSPQEDNRRNAKSVKVTGANIQAEEAFASINISPGLPVSTSPRRRNFRRKELPPNNQPKVSPSARWTALARPNPAPPLQPNILVKNESPSLYADVDTHPKPLPFQSRKSRKSDETKSQAKIEDSGVILDTPKSPPRDEVNNTSIKQGEEIHVTANFAQRSQHPHVESFYSASEAASSQITLLTSVSELRRSRSNPSDSRFEKHIPQKTSPTSESGNSTLSPGSNRPLSTDTAKNRDERTKKWAESIQTGLEDAHLEEAENFLSSLSSKVVSKETATQKWDRATTGFDFLEGESETRNGLRSHGYTRDKLTRYCFQRPSTPYAVQVGEKTAVWSGISPSIRVERGQDRAAAFDSRKGESQPQSGLRSHGSTGDKLARDFFQRPSTPYSTLGGEKTDVWSVMSSDARTVHRRGKIPTSKSPHSYFIDAIITQLDDSRYVRVQERKKGDSYIRLTQEAAKAGLLAGGAKARAYHHSRQRARSLSLTMVQNQAKAGLLAGASAMLCYKFDNWSRTNREHGPK